MLSDAKVEIALAIDPVKEELSNLKDRVVTWRRPSTNSLIPPASHQQVWELQAIVDMLDPNHRRVAFVGFPNCLSAEARIQRIDEFLKKRTSPMILMSVLIVITQGLTTTSNLPSQHTLNFVLRNWSKTPSPSWKLSSLRSTRHPSRLRRLARKCKRSGIGH